MIFVGSAKLFILELYVDNLEGQLPVLYLDPIEPVNAIEHVLVQLNHIFQLAPVNNINNDHNIEPVCLPVIFKETQEELVHNYSHCANVALCICPKIHVDTLIECDAVESDSKHKLAQP